MSPTSISSYPGSADTAQASPDALPRTWTANLGDHLTERVRLQGWLHNRRDLKAVLFLILRDASGTAQVIVENGPLRDRLADVGHQSVLDITGTVIAAAQAPGGIEIHDPEITVIGAVTEDLPLELHRPELQATLPTLLDHAAVALRHPPRANVQRVASAALQGFRSVLLNERFVEISTPKIVGAATEGGANVFALNYFGVPAYLAQSPQLYKQIMVGSLERVFETGPVFRAEPHDTARHLSQYVSLDAEMGFIQDHTTVMAIVTAVIRGMAASIAEPGPIGPALDVPATIPAIHFRDALEMISEATDDDVRAEPDLAPAHERWLGAWARSTHGSDWLFVTGYPMRKRPFYTHPQPDAPEWSNSFDLLYRGLEIVTGGQRLHRYEDYLAAMAERGMNPDVFTGYLQAFRFGMPPHGGFALGLERFVSQALGIANIREATLFPRDIKRLSP